LLPSRESLFAIKLPVTPNPQKTTPPLAVPSPCWAFFVWGPGKTEIRIEQRAGKWFLGFGGAEVDRRGGT
jgi:hypothetical protein